MDGKVGAGVFITAKERVMATESHQLPDVTTVHQAELAAIKEAASILINTPALTTVKFFVHSQAALKTLTSDFITSKLAFQTIQSPNQVQSHFGLDKGTYRYHWK